MKKGRKASAAATPAVQPMEMSLDQIHEMVWQSLPSIQVLLAERAATATAGANEAADDEQYQLLESGTRIPFQEVQQLVHCVHLATVSNPTPTDTHTFIEGIMGPADEGGQNTYAKTDLLALFDDLVEDFLKQKAGAEDPDTLRRTCAEIAQCITQDEPPCPLLAPESVLTISNALSLRTPLADFVTFREHPLYAPVYDELWSALQDGRDADTLSLNEFKMFFAWFHRLHVEGTTATRCEAAALPVWRDGVNTKGKMDRAAFQAVCQQLCERYAQRLDTDVYLARLLDRTRQGLQDAGSATEGVVLFSAADAVLRGIQSRIQLTDPKQLYMPQVLHAWDLEVNPFAQQATPNRIFLTGRRGTGKTRIGRHLAEALRARHIDVVSLALRSLAADEKEEIDMTLTLCVEKGTAIPLDVQAALIRRELEQPHILYHGYVFSDPIVFSESMKKAVVSFYERSGLLDVVQPKYFVELTCPDCVYEEQLHRLLADYEDASRDLFNNPVDEQEEKKNMLKQCTHIIEKYQKLLEVPDMPQEDLEDAALQAEEAQQIIAALEAEEETAPSAAGDDAADGEAKARDAEAESARKAAVLEGKVAMLVHKGRVDLFQGTEAPLRSVPGIKALMDGATAMDAVTSVSGLSPTEEVVSYVSSVFGLSVPAIATEVPLLEKPEITPTREQEEEAYGGLIEQAAANENIALSYHWKKYCPVSFLTDQVLVEGAPYYSCVFENRLYYFASLQKKADFMAYPTRFLSHAPVSRQPLLLIADPSLFDMQKVPSKEQLVVDLADALKLTPIPLPEFMRPVESYTALRDDRKAVQTTKENYTATEGTARRERAEKRRLAAARKAGKKKGDKAKANVVIVESEKTETAPPPPPTVKRIQDSIARTISDMHTTAQTVVPVLLTAVENNEENIKCAKLLLTEDLVPSHVIVLDYTEEFLLPPREEEMQGAREEKQTVFESQKDLLAEIETGAAAKTTISRLNIFGKSEKNLILEIQQIVNPAFAQVEDGQVDEALEEDEEEEEPWEDGDEDNTTAAKAAPAAKPEPLLRPRHRFDHQFGALLQYCPVTFHKKGILVKGIRDMCLSYLGSLYLFASDEYREEFRANPLRFLRGASVHSTPPRLWLVGPSKAGKKTLASTLSERYSIPFFEYNRGFFEKCIECALSPSGGHVKNIFIPPQTDDHNYYLMRAHDILSHVRRVQKEEEENLKLREEAIKKLEELEEKQNEERSDAEEEEEEEDGEEKGEEYEDRLRTQAEFEPEEEADKQIRLSESYLRVASCVVRIEPFESKGYMMICPPFSVGDLDVLFPEGGIPEVIVNMNLSKETFVKRGTQIYEAEQKRNEDVGRLALQERRRAEEQRRQLEKKRATLLRHWRRRNIGADDPPSEGEEEAEAAARLAEPDEPAFGPPDFEGTVALQHEAIEEFVEAVEERLVKVVTLRVDLAPGAVLLSALSELNLHLESRISLLFAPEVVAYDKALRRLESGLYHYSVFQRTDPVRLADLRDGERRACFWKPDGTCMMPEGGDTEEDAAADAGRPEDAEPEDDGEITEYGSDDLEEMRIRNERRERQRLLQSSPRTVLLGPYIYFLETDTNLKKFLHNPIGYLEQAPPTPQPRDMPVVSVFEDDVLDTSFEAKADAGVKVRCLAESIAHNRGAVFVSVGKLLSWALRQPRLGSVARQAVEAVLAGGVSDELLQSLLRLRLSSADVKRYGAVLLNLPRTPEQLSATEERQGAPIVKVASLMSEQESDQHALLAAMASVMSEKAHVVWEAPHPSQPNNPTNLNEMVRSVDVHERESREAMVRRQHAFPVDLAHLYFTQKQVQENLSEYIMYCPYCWLESGDLIEVDQSLGAWYMGKYYFFSRAEFLGRFLADPTEVADPTSLRPLPRVLPEVVTDAAEAESLPLELQGCCPVLLFDTREHRGLRGLVEPVARPGSRACVVRYDGKAYALLDEKNKARFLQRPWEYIEGAVLPETRKCPLAPNRSAKDLGDEEFIRRQLYDSVATAMVAVGTVRPSYPGLSVEESALKFLALHLKAHNAAENNSIQNAQYAANFELFFKRATMYQAMTADGNAAEEGREQEFAALCDDYEKLQCGYHGIHTLAHLKNTLNIRRDSLL
ncbi:hypothetical protein STCU_09102 [Strigomonas culicis]|uniref:Cilia- and flagella-associated protein 206 n=1 Tax=Strigomonas culicis TaxID=28005 RepID=S9TUJ0_9TRYP|nr:hypothetical protein STCU_09102 [Strigomonas culicis]|eukprot:EPY20224.1 hypothetical protein STCU_09102 [Strigomonas culicis]